MDSTRSVRSMESRDTSQSRMRTGGGENESLKSGSYQSLATSSTEKKATHSEIEKRRRQKMNRHLNELVNHLPVSANNKAKKLDKITTLKLALQHMKNLKASSSLLSDSFLCQNYITPFELQHLVLRDPDDFMIVVKCDTNKILYASESCSNSIASPNELVDRVFFELVHPSDTKYVKEHLAFNDVNNTSGSISSFIINKSKAYSTGERRSFVCRIKSEVSNKRMSSSGSGQFSDIKKFDYKVVNFVGYIRSDLGSNLKYSESLNTPGFSPSPSTASSSSGYQSSAKINQLLSSNSSNMGMSSNSNSSSSDLNPQSMFSTHYNSQQQQQQHSATFPYKFANYHSMSLLNENMSTGGNMSDNAGPNISILNESFNDLNTSQTSSSNSNNNTAAAQSFMSSTSNHQSSSLNSGHSMIYYIILYGQIKPKSDDLSLDKFVTKYDSDGKFIYLEPEIYSLVGYLPHQLLSESLFNFVHPDDVSNVRRALEESIKSESHKAKSVEYRFKVDQSGSCSYLKIETVFYALHNPFNGHYEHTVAQNRLVTPLSPSSSTNKSSTSSASTANMINQFNNANFPQPVSAQLSWAPLTPSPEDCKEAQVNQQYAAAANLKGDKISTQSYKHHSSSGLHPMPPSMQHQQQQSVIIDNSSYGILQYPPSIQKSNSLNTSYHQLQTYNRAYQPSPPGPPPPTPPSQQQLQQLNKSLESSHQSMLQLPVYVSSVSQSSGGNVFHVPSSNYLVNSNEIKSEFDLDVATASGASQRFPNSFDLQHQQQQQHQHQVNSNHRHFSVPFMSSRGGGDNNINNMIWTPTENSNSKNNSNNNNN